jgi:hypothetical protein
MANIRTLKLNLLADTTDFSKGIKKASGQTESFSSKLGASMKSVAKNAALAGVAVAGMAVAFGVSAVKAFMEDEKSQRRLAKSLKNTTGATNKQIKAIEKYITKTSLATGIADDDLRPAFQRLTQTTKDTAKAQDLMSLALDISAGSGKSVESVSAALAKGYNGNLGALVKLGVGLDKATIKSGDFNVAQKELAKTFGGQSKVAANSFEGRVKRFKVAIDEAKESVGGAILEALQPFADKWLPRIATGIQNVIDGFTGKGGKGTGVNVGEAIKNVADAVGLFFEAFTSDGTGKTKTAAENVQTFADALNNVAEAIRAVSSATKTIKGGISNLGNFFTFDQQEQNQMNTNSGVQTFRRAFGIDPVYGLQPLLHPERYIRQSDGTYKKRALGGAVASRTPYLVGEHGAEMFVPNGAGRIVPNHALGGGTTIINLNGIVDAESARRTIEQLLQRSSIRTGAINLQGSVL